MRPPVKVNQTYYSLATLGISPDNFKLQNIGFESDRGIGISFNDTASGKRNFSMVNFKSNFNVMKKQNPSDSGCPHPTQNLIAFRAKVGDGPLIVQIFNMDSQVKIKSVKLEGTFAYWTWVSEDILGVVTNDAIYHLSTKEPQEHFTKVVERKGTVQKGQVISYSLDPQGKYASISAISTNDGGVTINGDLQLCLIEQAKQQSLQAHYGCFGKIKVHNETHESILFAYAERAHGTMNNKITISEIGTLPVGITQKFKVSFDFQYPQASPNEFPVYMTFLNKYGMLVVLTKNGTIFIFEVSTGSRILSSKISETNIITGALNYQTGGLYILNKAGNVIQMDIDDSYIVEFIKNNCPHIPNSNEVATNLAIRNGLPGGEQFFIQKFSAFMMSQQYKEAAEVVALSPGNVLRNKETIEKFRALPRQPNQPYPLLQYFFVIIEKSKLNEFESLEICGIVLNQNKIQFITKWIETDKLTFSEQLGDLVKPYNKEIALTIYEKANSSKTVALKLELGHDINSVIQTGGNMANVDFVQMIKDNVDSNPSNALAIAKNLTKSGKVTAAKVAEIFMQANRPQELTSF